MTLKDLVIRWQARIHTTVGADYIEPCVRDLEASIAEKHMKTLIELEDGAVFFAEDVAAIASPHRGTTRMMQVVHLRNGLVFSLVVDDPKLQEIRDAVIAAAKGSK